MRTIVLLIAVLAAVLTHAQVPFIKLYDAVGLAPLTMNELPSGDILVNMASSRGCSVLDEQGNLVRSTHYWNSLSTPVGGPFNIRRRSSNEYYFVTDYTTSDPCFAFFDQRFPVIGRMDSIGHVMDLRYYVLGEYGCENNPKDLEVLSDGGVITWGRNRNFFALRVAEDGTPVWGKYFGHRTGMQSFGRSGSFQFIRELPNGDLIAGMNMDTAGVVIARMDANGEFLWCKSYLRPGGMVHDCSIGSDGTFIITGATDTIASTNSSIPLPEDYHPLLFMMKLSSSGEVQWCRGYDSDPNLWYSRMASRLVRTQDGQRLLLGNIGMQGYNKKYRPLLIKTDQNGDTLWTRSVGRSGYAYSAADLLVCSDGGVVFNGVVDGDIGDLSSAFYFARTDSLGHLPCYERYHPITVVDLFPTDSSFTLNSTDGATMYELSVSDTSYAPIVVYDGCTFTTGMPTSPSRSRAMSIRPNPNTGRFTVEFQDPLMAESYYSVYDALGKLLLQRAAAHGQRTQEVDLGRYGPGTYVIKFTDAEGTCYERVVVE